MKEKLVTIFGTRPEIIRLSSLIPKLDKYFDHTIINTYQNSHPNLNKNICEELNITSDQNLEIDTTNLGQEIGDIIFNTWQALDDIKPDKLLILGDTYSGLSVIPASRLNIQTFHMEAGMRSYDKRMPEESNRKIIDHLSDINLPYTENSKQNLLRENIPPNKIFVTGNPIFEVLENNMDLIDESYILEKWGRNKVDEDGGSHPSKIYSKEYYLVTIHRHENVTNPVALKNILKALDKLSKKYKVIVLTHPRFKQVIGEIGEKLQANPEIMLTDNVGFFDFVKLQKNAKCVLTDSGTVPEECAYLQVPCVSVRDSFERNELIDSGMTVVSGTETESILRAVEISENIKWRYKFETNVSDKVLKILGGNFD